MNEKQTQETKEIKKINLTKETKEPKEPKEPKTRKPIVLKKSLIDKIKDLETKLELNEKIIEELKGKNSELLALVDSKNRKWIELTEELAEEEYRRETFQTSCYITVALSCLLVGLAIVFKFLKFW